MIDGEPPTVHFTGFRPSAEDDAGLSVYRARDVSPESVAAGGRRSGEYFVVSLPVRALNELGLTVIPDPQADAIPGHALIPELSLSACARDKKRLRAVQVRLAELASASIVLRPSAVE